MKYFVRPFVIAVVAHLSFALLACSDEPDKATSSKKDAEAACEHVNSVCAGQQGMQKFECGTSNASYAKLDDAQKRQADGVAACVMAAKSCDPALECLRSVADSTTSADEASRRTHDTADACEHINDVCEGSSGFQTQDCSNSRADYEQLSAADKKLADSITPCIMAADRCEDAFACLELD